MSHEFVIFVPPPLKFGVVYMHAETISRFFNNGNIIHNEIVFPFAAKTENIIQLRTDKSQLVP